MQEYQKRIQSEKENLSNLNPDDRKATEQSIAIEEALTLICVFTPRDVIKQTS